MVVDFKNKKDINKVGNKAKFLIEMLNSGFNVPNGFVIDSDTFKYMMNCTNYCDKNEVNVNA